MKPFYQMSVLQKFGQILNHPIATFNWKRLAVLDENESWICFIPKGFFRFLYVLLMIKPSVTALFIFIEQLIMPKNMGSLMVGLFVALSDVLMLWVLPSFVLACLRYTKRDLTQMQPDEKREFLRGKESNLSSMLKEFACSWRIVVFIILRYVLTILVGSILTSILSSV